MCELQQKIAILARRSELDLNDKRILWNQLCEGIAKYLAIEKLYQLRHDSTIAFDGLKAVFSNFYGLHETRGTINKENLWYLLKEGNNAIPIKIILKLLEAGKTQLVFASKALHTFDTNLPIIDSITANFFSVRYHGNTPNKQASEEERLEYLFNFATNGYNQLLDIYRNEEKNLLVLKDQFDKLIDQSALEYIANYVNAPERETKKPFSIFYTNAQIRRTVSEYITNNIQSISNIKKIDFMIWCYWRTQFETVDCVPQTIEFIHGNPLDGFFFLGNSHNNSVVAINSTYYKSTKTMTQYHPEKYYKIYCVNQ